MRNTYGSGTTRWNEYYTRKKKEDFKSDLILVYFAVVIIAYFIIVSIGA